MAGRGEEVLLLAATGLTDKEIAEKLCISVRTVEGHWRRLREQSGLPNRAGLVAKMVLQQQNFVHTELTNKNDSLQTEIEQLNKQNFSLKGNFERIQEESKRQSAVLQSEINALYQEVTRLKHQSQSALDLQSIVVKGSVLAFKVQASSPYQCVFMSDSIRLFGYKPTDFTSGFLPITSIFHPEDFALAWTDALGQVKSGTHRLDRKYRLITKRGEERTVLDRCIYEEATEECCSMLSFFAFDITHTLFAEILGEHPNLK